MLKYLGNPVYLRYFSIKHATVPPVKYTDTINLPKTKFPNRLNASKRELIERQLLANFAKTYSYQECHNKEPAFVLHDGPPYANGDLHMGHAVNKILKDICLRYHVCKGTKVHYIPGWDCHGLPIELKATTENLHADPLDIRERSRKFALEAVERQKEAFRSWGVIANWSSSEHVYLTMNPKFITKQFELFYSLYNRGLVYRDLKPVFWSPSSRTALAESELEYDQNFVSPSVYLRFSLTSLPARISSVKVPVYALVWTTTPWTLPSNQAICYNSDFEYALVKLLRENVVDNEFYLLASNLIDKFTNETKIQCEVICKIQGSEFDECTYQHPIDKLKNNLSFFDATHVQDTKGTGFVHTAPAHGPEDFLVSLQQKMPLLNYVNEKGNYTSEAPEFLCGKSVIEEGDELVLKNIKKEVVHFGKLTHAYPIDWRTKKPVILRASEQWFMNTDRLKDVALEELTKIQIYPGTNADTSKRAMETQLRKRPFWCISRQRVWGTPIPVFYRKDNGAPIVNQKIITHISDLVKKYGNADFWWSHTNSDILPQSILNELKLDASEIVRGKDIFDIWFDSGSTWANVLGENQKADLYLEGLDQFTGWFQSSLLTSVAARNSAPYKSLFVHGFTVDAKGHKMSKSLGNVIVPKDITNKYGTDVLRWWVASHATQNMSITVSDQLLKQSAENLNKVRATLRYLNGAIGEAMNDKESLDDDDYDASKDSSLLNRYLLSTLIDFEQDLQRSYNDYEFNRAVVTIQNFITNEISSIFIHSIKDRLYCGTDNNVANIRYTLLQCYRVLCKALWPLTPFLVEESWHYYSKNRAFYERPVKIVGAWKNDECEQVINSALIVKRLINQSSSDVNTWTLAVEISCGGIDHELMLSRLKRLHGKLDEYWSDSELCEILQVNRVKLLSTATSSNDISVRIEPIKDVTLCPRCRRFALENDDITCERCSNVLNMRNSLL